VIIRLVPQPKRCGCSGRKVKPIGYDSAPGIGHAIAEQRIVRAQTREVEGQQYGGRGDRRQQYNEQSEQPERVRASLGYGGLPHDYRLL
jgi:hypothetical protein